MIYIYIYIYFKSRYSQYWFKIYTVSSVRDKLVTTEPTGLISTIPIRILFRSFSLFGQILKICMHRVPMLSWRTDKSSENNLSGHIIVNLLTIRSLVQTGRPLKGSLSDSDDIGICYGDYSCEVCFGRCIDDLLNTRPQVRVYSNAAHDMIQWQLWYSYK